MNFNSVKKDIRNLIEAIRSLEKKPLIILLSVAILQTVSWYYSSRAFFRVNIWPGYSTYEHIYLVEYLYWFLADFFTLGIIPVLLIIFLLKEKPKDYGITFGDYKSGFLYSGIFLAFMIVILWFVSAQEEFAQVYPHYPYARNNWNVFFVFEAGMLFYMIGWEFIWRGFTLFGLFEKFGYYAVLIQMIPFVILHNGKPPLETFSSIIGGIALGILALKTRSFLYCVIIHFGIMFTIDFFSVMRYRTADYGVSFNSLINLIKNLF